MANVYEKYLEKAKVFNYSEEKYERLEEIIVTAKKAGLPLGNPLEITDRFEFSLSLTPAAALFESHQVHGNEGYIIYLDNRERLVAHFVNGQIDMIDKRR